MIMIPLFGVFALGLLACAGYLDFVVFRWNERARRATLEQIVEVFE